MAQFGSVDFSGQHLFVEDISIGCTVPGEEGTTIATPIEIAYVADVVPGTVDASKAVVVDASKDIAGLNNVSQTGTLTVGVDDTGADVKFYGATSGKSWLWDESGDEMIVTGDVSIVGDTANTGTITVGVDDTGHDVKLYGATTGKSLLWDESADKLIVTGDTALTGTTTVVGDLSVTAGGSLTTSVAGTIVPVIPMLVQQAVSTATAVNITTYNTTIDSTSGALALTLADSTVTGQLKRIQMIVDNGAATLTFNTTATIVFADVGDTAELVFNGTIWVPIALYNIVDGATAPAYTPAA